MKLRHFLFFLALVFLVVLLIKNYGNIAQFTSLLSQFNIFILLLALPLRYLYYWANTKYFEAFFHLPKKKIKFTKLFHAVVTMNFVNTVFPSGGISGVTYLSKVLEPEIEEHQSVVAQAFWYVCNFVALILLTMTAFLALILFNQISRISSRFVILLISFIVAGGLVLIMVSLNRKMAEKIVLWAVWPINRVLRRLKRDELSKIRVISVLDEFYEVLNRFLASPLKYRRPVGFAIINTICDILTIYVVFSAFGIIPNPGVVITGYVLALIASAASIFTSGVGIYEATMTAVFVSLGVPFTAAFAVTVVYRIVALWLFIPVGLIFYKRTMLDEPDGS